MIDQELNGNGAPFASGETDKINTAVVKAMAVYVPPAKDKPVEMKGKTKEGREYKVNYKYAPLNEIISSLRKPLTDNGLWFRQFVVSGGRGEAMQRTIVYHSSGQWYGGDFPIFASREGAQGFASGSTAARRYGLALAFGIEADDDDDANLADATQATIGTVQRPAAAPAYRPANPPPSRNNDPVPTLSKIRDGIMNDLVNATVVGQPTAILRDNAEDLELIKEKSIPVHNNLLRLAEAREKELAAAHSERMPEEDQFTAHL